MGQAANASGAARLFTSSTFPELKLTANGRVQQRPTNFKRRRLCSPRQRLVISLALNSNLTYLCLLSDSFLETSDDI